jgi:pyruvate/2-oxoglutarate dehydrogenase complex dihydrolipoamide dehydrogenase (E3) component
MHRSFWLHQALVADDEVARLRGDHGAEVAIIGGGYVGLWTALTIKELDPGVDVAEEDKTSPRRTSSARRVAADSPRLQHLPGGSSGCVGA